MPPVVRVVPDTATGHTSFPPDAVKDGSKNVIVNSYSCAREGDLMVGHGSPSPSPYHQGSIGKGSDKVIVNSQGCARVLDPVTCGESCSGGSGNVLAG